MMRNKKVFITIAVVVAVVVGGVFSATCVSKADSYGNERTVFNLSSIFKTIGSWFNKNKNNNNNNSSYDDFNNIFNNINNGNNNNGGTNNGGINNGNTNNGTNNGGINNGNNSNANLDGGGINNSSTVGCSNWMSKIPDNRSLADITIPGAHDAATCKVQLSTFSQCQNKSIKDLLSCGFRYLDARLGLDGNKLRFYHGSTSCLQPNGSGNLYLESVLSDCYSFLQSNPSETILFSVKKENGNGSVANFQSVLNSYISQNANKWLLTSSVPNLASARGKIVLLRRDSDEARLGNGAGIPNVWRDQGDKSNTSLSYEDNQNEGRPLLVQDRYKYSTNDKWRAFESTLNMSSQRNGSMKINFLSTAGSGLVGSPKSFASSLNNSLMSKQLKGSNLGWIVVDFGDSNIASHIYSANF